MNEPKPTRDLGLSTEYHKARKQLMLWAGILFIWELVGIDLEKAKITGGNVGAIIGAIKSPQAIPWALLILVMYFAFKMRIEWGQCNLTRRDVRESRLDYYSAFVVAAAAVVLYLGQAISQIQFADAVGESSKLDSVLIGVSITAGVLICGYFLWERFSLHKSRNRNDLVWIAFCYLGLFIVPTVGSFRKGQQLRWLYLFLGVGIGLITVVPLIYFSGRKQRRYYGASEKTAGASLVSGRSDSRMSPTRTRKRTRNQSGPYSSNAFLHGPFAPNAQGEIY